MCQMTVLLKPCGCCRRFLSLDGFAIDRSKACGLKSQCRRCSNERNAAWKTENREQLADAARRRRNRGKPSRTPINTQRSADSLQWWGWELDNRRTWRELANLDEALVVQARSWNPARATTRGGPEQPPRSRELVAEATRILKAAATNRGSDEAETFDGNAVVDAEGWVMPWWLAIADRPTLRPAVAS